MRNRTTLVKVAGMGAVAAALAAFMLVPDSPALQPSSVAIAQEPMAIEASTATAGAPELLVPQMTNSPIAPTAEQLAARRAHMDMVEQAWMNRAPLPAGNGVPEGPPADSQTSTDAQSAAAGMTIEIDTPENAPAPLVPGTHKNFLVAALKSPSGFTSTVAEPSAAQSGKYVWLTHNWYAARSTNGGKTYTYVSPYADFPAFCCDQDTIYDKHRDMYLWYRQGIYSGATGQNQFKLGVSTNHGASFCTYTFQPNGIDGSWTGQWFDYPHVALSKNYAYITTNMFSGGGAFLRMLVVRLPLDSLVNCAGFGYNYWFTSSGWTWTPTALGATDTMYLGDHTNQSTFRLYWQNESDTVLNAVDRAVPAWTFTNRNGSCPVAGGANPCARADQRVVSGWVRRNQSGGEIGFFWNVKEGGGFPKPYTEAVTFNEQSKLVTGRPLIWNDQAAWHWANAAGNEMGDIGMAVSFFHPALHPQHYVAIEDEYTANPPGWAVVLARSSTRQLTASNWGDYLRVRPHEPQGVGWVATGHTIQQYTDVNGAVVTGSQVHFVRFGRERDTRGINRYVTK